MPPDNELRERPGFAVPDDWTFKTSDIASRFDEHVREQLPWYDAATALVAHLARSYIPQGGIVYDLGAATGNVGRALATTLDARHAELWQVESSVFMADALMNEDTDNIKTMGADAAQVEYAAFDLAVAFLTLSFIPIPKRCELVRKLVTKLRAAGAIIVVDKFTTGEPRLASSLRRFTMATKLEAGATPRDVLAKELSLEGVQIPLDGRELYVADESVRVSSVFQMAEFRGYVIERLPE